jgi:DENN domain-containing protein 2
MDVMFDEDHRELLEMEENLSSSKDKSSNMNKHRVSRSMTEKRKDYVCRVTQNPTNLVGLNKLPSAASIITQFQQIIDSNKEKSPPLNESNEPTLFKMVVLIGYDSSTKKGYIKSIFPKKEKPLPLLDQFVYPTSHDELMTSENQTFSIIFTDEYGNHLFGYCRSVIPEGFSKSLPFTYCIISDTLATGLFFNVLKEIETRHGMPEANYFNMLSVLQRQKIPNSGKQLQAKFGMKRMPEIVEKSSGDKNQKTPQNLNRKRLSLESPEWLKAEASKSPILNYKNCDEIIIQRSSDTRMEDADLGILYELTTSEQLVKIFGSLLIERKVILLGKNLSQVSSCVMALYSLLYPFQWHHTIISTVPQQLVEIIQAPFPFFVGVLKNSIDSRTLLEIEDGIVIDLDEKRFLKTNGDESSLLPECLKKSLLMSLKVVEIFENGNKLRNVLIGEAFLQFFVKIFAELKASTFDKRKFIDSHQDRSTKYFLEWYVETVMFKDFLERKKENNKEANNGRTSYFDLFDAKIVAKSAGQRESAETFMKNSKRRNKKNFRDRIRDFLSS